MLSIKKNIIHQQVLPSKKTIFIQLSKLAINQKYLKMQMQENPSTAKEIQYISLKVVSQDCKKINFKVKLTIKMEKLKMAYSKHVGIPVSSLRFLFDGRCINDNDTPEQLQMEQNVAIEVFQEQKGRRTIFFLTHKGR
jgi:small ubiquitin-related modifier